jgi:signal transduction histidine kinase
MGVGLELFGLRKDEKSFRWKSARVPSTPRAELWLRRRSRDVTERKLAEAQIKKLNDELELALQRSDRLASTGRLVATIAQEINNRLDSLFNMMHLLRTNANLDEPAKEPVEQAEEEIARLSKLTKQGLAPHRETDLPAAMKMTTVLDDVCSLLQGKL